MSVSPSELDSCEQCGAPLSRGQCARCLLSYALDENLREESPQRWRLGDYEIGEKIARGGMGVVFRARQLSLNRPVAVKMILGGELASPEAVQRFRIEAEAAAKLRHPNIVSVYDVGEWEYEHYIAMELIEGGSVGDRTWTDGNAIATLVAKMARALSYAHEHGVLHRDLKPSNILLDDLGEPRLTDFGLAKLADQDQGLTLSQAMLGSPGYMAPEQTSKAEVTTAADVYGLGAVMYEMLSGKPPFTGASAVETLRRVMDERPPALPPKVPRDLATICLKCLEKAPANRYASARDLAEDCERFVRGEAITARPVSRLEHLARWAKRHPVPAVLASIAILQVIGAVTGIVWQWRRAETANVQLKKSVNEMEWRRTVQLLNEDDRSLGLAELARLLRRDLNNPRAISMALSALEQSHLATPVSKSIAHGKGIVILQARLSPDGKRIVTAGADGTARLWDADTAQPLGKIMTHAGTVHWVEFSADGTKIVSASDDKTARLWDAHSGEPLAEPFPHEARVLMAKFIGDQVVSVSDEKVARIWPSGKKLELEGLGRWIDGSADGNRIYIGSSKSISAWNSEGVKQFEVPAEVKGITLSPDGGRLAGWSDKNLLVWDAASGKDLEVKFEEAVALYHAAWSPDGKMLAGASIASWARIWNPLTGEALTNKLQHLYRVEFVAFSPDGRMLMSGGDDGRARFWNVTNGAPLFVPLNHNDGVLGAQFTKDGSHLMTLSKPWGITMTHGMGEVQMWDLRHRGQEPWRFKASSGAAGTAWSHDGKLCATCSINGEVFVHDTTSGRALFGPWKNTGWARGIAFLPDDRRVALITGKGELSVWSMDTNARVLGPLHTGSIEAGRFSHDGMKLLSGATDGEVLVWDLATGEIICRPQRHIAPLNGLAFSPDDRFIATAGEEGQCFVSELATGRKLFPGIRHENEIVSVQFSPDGKWITTSSHDRTARMWDAHTGEPHGAPMRHRGEVAYAEFSHDGTRVLTACRDGTACLWDASTGAALAEPMMHQSALRGATFSPDDHRIATEDHDGLRIWQGADGEPLSVLQPQHTSVGIGYNAQGLHVAFSPDGQSVLHGIASAESIRWSFPEPPTPAPSWLPDLLEAVAGTQMTESNAIEPLPTSRWLEIRERLRTLPGGDFFARWARTFCAEPK